MNHLHIITGAPGTGKTTLLTALQKRTAIHVIDEPARTIIQEQRHIGGQGTYEQNNQLFAELMLSRAMLQFNDAKKLKTPVLFDRGIPDILAYINSPNADINHFQKATQLYRYHPTVFFLPCWQEIFINDEERQLSFEEAVKFGDAIRQVYLSCNYKIVEIPLLPIEERVEYLLKHL